MGIVTRPNFVTSDGKSFTDLAEAEAHELSLQLSEQIEAIAATHEISARMTASLKRYVPLFINELGFTPRSEPEAEQPDIDFTDQDAQEAA